MSIKTIYIYADKFQPPHLGKKVIWDLITKRYGIDNCFISASETDGPLSFSEKQSIFASMGIDSGNVIKSDKMFSQIKLPSEFDPSSAIVIWITTKENVKIIPNTIKPHSDSAVVGGSYYMTIPNLTTGASSTTDDQVVSFLGGTPMTKDANMVAFKKIFGFFDEYLYGVLVDKFKNEILNESPDSPKGFKGIYYDDHDAVAFVLFDTFTLEINQSTHDTIGYWYMVFHQDVLNGDVDLKKNTYRGKQTFTITGNLNDAFKQVKTYEEDKYPYRDEIRSIGVASGRIWPNKRVVSLWIDDYSELSPADFKILTDYVSEYGDPKSYKYDDASEEIDVTKYDTSPHSYEQAEQITSHRQTQNQSMGDRFKDMKHVMNPVLKNILKTFDKDTPYNKRAVLADKLGMTVAQLNSLLNIEENH